MSATSTHAEPPPERGKLLSYLDNLPPDVAARVAMNRIVGTAEAAAFCGFSLSHWRLLYRTKKVPAGIRINDRKLGWRLADLAAFMDRRADSAPAA